MQRHINGKKTVRAAPLVVSVASVIDKNRRQRIDSLATAHGTSVSSINVIVPPARRVPNCSAAELEQERVDRHWSRVRYAIYRRSLAMLDNIEHHGPDNGALPQTTLL